MKYFCGIALLIGIWSCSESHEKKPEQTVALTKDSNIIKRESVNPYAPVDISPMDMTYLPVDYPVLKMTGRTNKPPVARVIYSRPHRQGRKIFGSLLKYGEPWRLGANEATEIEVFEPMIIQHKTIPKGRYVLYCIPQADKWTIVFNSNLYTWGLKIDPKKDLYKFDIPVQVKNQTIEYFTMEFEKTGSGADLIMAWDDEEARLPIAFNER
jgi:hypothetical protein